MVDEGENCSEGGREEGDGNEVCGIISFISITHNQVTVLLLPREEKDNHLGRTTNTHTFSR